MRQLLDFTGRSGRTLNGVYIIPPIGPVQIKIFDISLDSHTIQFDVK